MCAGTLSEPNAEAAASDAIINAMCRIGLTRYRWHFAIYFLPQDGNLFFAQWLRVFCQIKRSTSRNSIRYGSQWFALEKSATKSSTSRQRSPSRLSSSRASRGLADSSLSG